MTERNYNELLDTDLSRMAASGNMLAIETIYRRHYQLMLNFGMKYYADTEFIKDCIQDLFVKIISHPALFRHVEFVRPWLLISLKNIMFDKLKAIKPFSSLEELPFLTLEEDIITIAQAEGLDDEQMKDRQNLAKAFTLLGGSQRMAIYLHFVKGLSHNEVVALLNMNVQSSRNLLSRAIAKLRKNMFALLTLLPI